MYTDATLTVMTIFMCIFSALYFWFCYVFIFKKDVQQKQVRRFYNAIINIYRKQLSIPDSFTQLKLNYEKLNQAMTNTTYNSILDLLETIIYNYDTYPDKLFKSFFKFDKQEEIRDFLMQICIYIKEDNPFISAPLKEAELMRTLKNALDNNNPSLGINSLMQLSLEIETKEKLLSKKDKENQRANIISIAGIILTTFFGFLSLYPILFKN